ncbi:hypothetical protein VP382E491_P0026 [Vibrio phage 382E49-1]|nr:hypothetical protein VP141O351_P0025 [Vibrio phage 141O35-1]CAH9015164.1 hypothetical protein VP141E351_P0024 [Vibrio phage 141E35-1]CAH9015710.1 hypothetical protein VP382E491_P0026 [Vibrio phage 382E49-1]
MPLVGLYDLAICIPRYGGYTFRVLYSLYFIIYIFLLLPIFLLIIFNNVLLCYFSIPDLTV